MSRLSVVALLTLAVICADAARAEPGAVAKVARGAAADTGTPPKRPDGDGGGSEASGEGDAEERRGLLPFLPEWVPLGPPWEPVGKLAKPVPPPSVPETMRESAPPGAEPDPELPQAGRSTWTFVPVPIVYADPNLGFGIGLMPVVLLHPRKRIEWILAPSFDYNDLLGVSFTNRIYFYPTIQEELFVYNDFSTEGKMENEARFHGHDRFVHGSDFFLRGYILRDPTRRFYGIGADTDEEDETDYEQRESAVEADIGYYVLDELRLAATLRYRYTRTRRGIVDKRPDTVDVFPDLGGVKDELTTVLAYGMRLTLDLRDDVTFPTRGVIVDVFGEASARGVISSTAFWRWGVTATGFYPIGVGAVKDAVVAVLHTEYRQVSGDDRQPFWERPTLGGRSRLRGFGVGRFTDEAYLLFAAEARVRVHDFRVRDNRLRIELAAFFDTGRVYGSTALNDEDWQYVPGLGARLLLPDSGIIARGDVGFGGEGAAVFLVLGYPF